MTASPMQFIRYAADLALSQGPANLDVRPYTCNLVVIKEIGADRPGHNVSSTSVTITPLLNITSPIRVRRASSRDISLSNALLKDQDLILGPFVFPYNTGTVTGGFDITQFDSSYSDSTQVFIQVAGPGLAPQSDGYAYFSKIYDDITQHATCYKIYVRNTGSNPLP